MDMSRGLLKHLHHVTSQSSNSLIVQKCQNLTVDQILDRIHYFRVTNREQQIALMKQLPYFIQQHPNIRLVVFDSISFHFRYELKNMGLRTRLLASLAQEMMSLAETYNISVCFLALVLQMNCHQVVYTNQVLTRVYANQQAELVVALGDSWGQCASTRVRLYWQGYQRYAFLHKAPDLPQREVPYSITEEGIRTATQNNN
eukprot:g2452.t1